MNAAQGYSELGMFEDALAELDTLSEEEREHPAALQMRLLVLMRMKRWVEGLEIAAKLREQCPELPTGYIHGAFCLHELGRTQEAKEMLLSGPPTLLAEPTYFYNLGCYDATLGNLEEAVKHLKMSFQMDEKFREIAKYDPDLKLVGDLLESV